MNNQEWKLQLHDYDYFQLKELQFLADKEIPLHKQRMGFFDIGY